jgi:hypothetical protein
MWIASFVSLGIGVVSGSAAAYLFLARPSPAAGARGSLGTWEF